MNWSLVIRQTRRLLLIVFCFFEHAWIPFHPEASHCCSVSNVLQLSSERCCMLLTVKKRKHCEITDERWCLHCLALDPRYFSAQGRVHLMFLCFYTLFMANHFNVELGSNCWQIRSSNWHSFASIRNKRNINRQLWNSSLSVTYRLLFENKNYVWGTIFF